MRSRLAVQLGQDQSNYDLNNHEDDQDFRALLVESGNGRGTYAPSGRMRTISSSL